MIAGHPPLEPAYAAEVRRGLSAQSLGLLLTWLAMATSSFVFSEPAPYDALMVALIVSLPLLGLSPMSQGLFLQLIAWLVIGAGGFIAAARSGVMDISVKHTLITLYLSLSAVVIAGFVRKNPERHSGLIISGMMFASLVAAALGIAGYFDLAPSAGELFTKFDRARGAFKDPNVFGPFLVPALVYYVHTMATSGAGSAIIRSVLSGFIALALLVSFSRGAWFNAAIALLVYAYVTFIAARTNRFRLKLLFIAVFALCAAAIGLAAVMQVDSIAKLISERATLALAYDTGPEGRFGGQLKALEMIAGNPFGIGAQAFGRSYHGEDVHNVYLSMFLNAGWIGGFLYLGLVAATLAVAFRHSLRPSATQGITIIMLASFTGLAAEGMIVDTDHWRHFYLLTGMIWGLVLARETVAFSSPVAHR